MTNISPDVLHDNQGGDFSLQGVHQLHVPVQLLQAHAMATRAVRQLPRVTT